MASKRPSDPWSESGAPRHAGAPGSAPSRPGLVVAAAVIVLGLAGALLLVRSAPALDACDVVPGDDIRAIGGDGVGRTFVPEGDHRHATVCSYGRAPGVHVSVFALPHGGRDIVDLQQRSIREQGVVQAEVSDRGYRGYLTAGPMEHSESVVVLRGDRYVNVIIYNGPPGAAERLVPVAARGLD